MALRSLTSPADDSKRAVLTNIIDRADIVLDAVARLLDTPGWTSEAGIVFREVNVDEAAELERVRVTVYTLRAEWLSRLHDEERR